MGHIESEATRLRERHNHVQSIKVVIEKPNQRHRYGNNLRATILVSLRGKQLFSSKQSTADDVEDARVAVTAAFNSLESEVNSLERRSEKSRSRFRFPEVAFDSQREDRSWTPC